MSMHHDDSMNWWLRLRHGGQLLDRTHLENLPDPRPLPWNLPNSLRAASLALPDDGAAAKGPELTALIDLMMESVAGLKTSWLKGAKVGSEYGETLLDGTGCKPRRIWKGPHGGMLHVFTTTVRRVGLHRGRRPVAQITEYLRRRREPLALLTNGRQWRLIFADADTQAWVEWDTSEFFEGGQISDTVVGFSRLMGWKALATNEDADTSALLGGIAGTRQGQAKLSSELGERVRKAVEALLISRRPVLEAKWDELDSQAVYVAASHFVMRLVVTLFAEARGLLPLENPVYHNAYGVTGLLESLDRVSPLRLRSRHSGWSRLLALFSLLYDGSPHPALTLPAYGGDLFRTGKADGDAVQRALAVLESTEVPPDDGVIHDILVMLTRTTVRVRDGKAWRRVSEAVNFTDLSSEYIGILYEGLLDYELHKAGDDAVLFLNLGDQPALPISRLEAMDDKAIKALVEKVKGSEGLVVDDEEETAQPLEELAPDNAPGEQGEKDEDDDLREAALRRAMEWALRAVRIGKLVKKAKKGESKDEKQQRAADALIADLKLPGELYLVRWGGTRKGAGTFYTRPQLTMPTVRRTLEPLTHVDGKEKTPEEVLQLKVVDPAMGSGSFLVAALRVLTKAIFESAYAHGRIQTEGNRTRVEIATFAESDRVFPFPVDDPRFADDFTDTIKRYVVEHCLYGVDIDPLAVELARVALWVETLDDKLPFTFLDHKLRAGNSLVGCWLEHFRDYPALAWKRESPDKAHDGVHHQKNTWHRVQLGRQKEATAETQHLSGGQGRLEFAGGDDTQVHDDVRRMRNLFGRLRRIPANEPARRAKLYRTKIKGDAALGRLRTAFDVWCALWFWPSDQLASAPMPRDFLSPPGHVSAAARQIAQEQRFFHWELEFPDVFHSRSAGFDAVVGNPPWETIHAQSLEFFSNLDPLFRSLPPKRALERRKELFAANIEHEHGWLRTVSRVKSIANWVSNSGAHTSYPFRFQGKGKPYTHRLFLELGLFLLRKGGRLGLVVPSSTATEKGGINFREHVVKHNSWEWFFDFQNSTELFPIHRSSRFAACIIENGGTTSTIRAQVMEGDVTRWSQPEPPFMAISTEFLRRYSPEDWALPLFGHVSDTAIVERMLGSGQRFLGDGTGDWAIQYSREFNMSDDKDLFVRRDRLETLARMSDVGHFRDQAGIQYYPLLEGRNVGRYHCFSKRWISGKGRSAVWERTKPGNLQTGAQYYVQESDFEDSVKVFSVPKVAVMDVTGATNSRSIVASCAPYTPSGHSVNNAVVVNMPDSHERVLALCGVLNSFCFDWFVRQTLTGQHVSRYFLKGVPLPQVSGPVLQVAKAVLRLNCCHPLFGSWWGRMHGRSYDHSKDWALTEHERLRLLCIIDAVVAAEYGLSWEEYRWILRGTSHTATQLEDRKFCKRLDPKGFWRIDKGKRPEHRHTVLSLVAFRDLLNVIDSRDGDRSDAIRAFCSQDDGEGWVLPEALRLADYDLGHDERARECQPVAAELGPRYLKWQLGLAGDDGEGVMEHQAGTHAWMGHASGNAEVADQESVPQMTLGLGGRK